MPRFFRRLAEGVFDEDDVRRRAFELGDFVEDARRRHGIGRPIALGYSNGANIAAALMLLRPEVLAGAALLRAMVPLSDPPHPDLSRVPVLIASGKADPIVPASNSAKLAAMLRDAGADVSHHVLPGRPPAFAGRSRPHPRLAQGGQSEGASGNEIAALSTPVMSRESAVAL
jgi:phospholipase/carboxylesterase